MTKIVAFAGRKQSGKTTCSNAVSDYWKLRYPEANNCNIYNFADALKEDICINILGLTHDQCYGDDEQKNSLTELSWENKKLTAREVMQFVGTDIFRKLKIDVWTSATLNKIKKDNHDLAIIADCRFPNEVESIKDHGGVVIKLTRNPYNSDHESEKALDPSLYDDKNFDLVLMNHTMTIDAQVAAIYRFLRKRGILPL